MTEADILHWFRDTSLGAAVRHSRWMFTTGETFHFLGLSLLVGGFVINLLTGILFFTADPMMYWPNPAFRLKMFLILLAGINALIFTLFKHRQALALGDDDQATTFMKVSAGLSLSLWLVVLLLGRLLPAFEGSTSFF